MDELVGKIKVTIEDMGNKKASQGSAARFRLFQMLDEVLRLHNGERVELAAALGRITAYEKILGAPARAQQRPVEASPAEVTPPRSYAAATREVVRRHARPAPPVVMIYGEEGATSEATEKVLKERVCPQEAFIKVKAVRRTRSGAVAVETATKEDSVKLQKAAAEKGLRAEAPKGIRPRIRIRRVPEDLGEETLSAEVFRGNFEASGMTSEEFKGGFKPLRRLGKPGGAYQDWVVEVTPKLRESLISSRVLLAWTSCRVEDHLEVFHCYRCLGYGHRASMCKRKEVTCRRCGKEGHLSTACPSRDAPPKCAACERAGKPGAHVWGDPTCPARMYALRAGAVRTDYGQR